MALTNTFKLFVLVLTIAVTRQQEDDTVTKPKPIIKSLFIHSDIKYTYANTMVYSKILNPADTAQEVSFKVVLPEEAFITGLIMTIKDKSYDAYIKGKEEAKKEYDAAVQAGQGAALVQQEDVRNSKDFTVSVNVEPEEKVSFNLTYEELLGRKNKTYSNVINVNPRQVVDHLSIVVDIEDVLNIINVKAPPFKMGNKIDQTESVNPKAEKTVLAPNKVRVKWSPTPQEQKELNKDGLNGQMIVKYDVDASKNPQQILVDSDGYFVHILRNDNLPILPKHVVFVLDVSASMSADKIVRVQFPLTPNNFLNGFLTDIIGFVVRTPCKTVGYPSSLALVAKKQDVKLINNNKIVQLKDAMNKILLDLSESDHFTLILFSNKVLAWSPTSSPDLNELNSFDFREPANVPASEEYVISATKENVDKALKFVNSLDTYGGTNIMGGIRNGLKLARLGTDILNNTELPKETMMIFLTDGQPNSEESDPDKIVKNVGDQNKGVTVFSLGFGYDADMNFLKKLSLSNNGFARRIYEDGDASLQLQNFYKEVASPVLSDIKFEYLPDQVENTTSDSFKNLFSGSDVLVLGKLKSQGKVSGALTAKTTSGPKKFEIVGADIVLLPPIVEKNRTLGYLEKMWAYKTIKSLLDKNTVSKNSTLEDKAKELSLKYSFVTPLTSLVVVKPNNSAAVTDENKSYGRWNGGYPYGPFAGSPGAGAFGPPSFAFRPITPPPPHPSLHHLQSLKTPLPPNQILVQDPILHHLQSLESPLPPNQILVQDPILHHLQSLESDVFYPTTPVEAHLMKTNYTSVTWLNQTISTDGLFLEVPSSLNTTDVIALKEDDVVNSNCTNGDPCKHFIYCALTIFADDITQFTPYQCHIDPKYLGVCCPIS